MSSLLQGSSESHQSALSYDRPDRMRGRKRSLHDRNDYMETRLKTLYLMRTR